MLIYYLFEVYTIFCYYLYKLAYKGISMNKNKVKNIAIVALTTMIVIIGVSVGLYKYNKIDAYNNLIANGNRDMEQGEYDKAIALFEQSLQYKKDSNVERSIKLAQNLKEVKVIYDEGIKLLNDKKYLEAIEKFKKVTKEDDKLYNSAQGKIAECKKQYIAQNIELANNAVQNNKYDDANKYLEDILKVDADNKDAKKLKDDVAKLQQDKKASEEKKAVAASNNNASKTVTKEQAIQIIANRYKGIEDPSRVIVCTDTFNKDGKTYYSIVAQDEMLDHTANIGRYSVEATTGKAYEYDVGTDATKPIN